MNRKSVIQILGISLAVFFVPFLINKALALMPSACIGWYINESISDASYLQWKIETTEHYSVNIWLEDGDGEIINIIFSTSDNYDPGDYEVDEDGDYLRVYFSDSAITNESESFEDLISLVVSEADESNFDLTDDPEITRLQIFGGENFKLYSITLADNDDFDDPCWMKNAAYWSNLNDFTWDGGWSTDAGIRFYDAYIQVTNTAMTALHNSSGNSLWGMGNIGWNQPYNYGWNQPYSNAWNQPYNYGWNQPYSNAWNQPYNYGWNQPYNFSWNQPYDYGWNQPSYGWSSPYNYGWNQPYNPYGYQGFPIYDDGDWDYGPPDLSRAIWTDQFSGYDPVTGSFFMI